MKRILSIVAMLGLTGLGLNLAAQQTPAQTPSQTPSSPSQTTPQATPSPDSSMPQQPSATQNQTDATSSQGAARSFEGKIEKSGDKLVLQDSATQASYQLDDQDKAKQFKGKSVKVMATLDQATNTLHVVDISPAETK